MLPLPLFRGFTYAVEARASQSFRFVYTGTATILPVEDTATLLVKGTSTFTVKPKRVQNGDSVTFSGRVKGRPLAPKPSWHRPLPPLNADPDGYIPRSRTNRLQLHR